jgi:hypothetical protein
MTGDVFGHYGIREVREGPDGLLYLLTDEEDAALLRIERAPRSAYDGYPHPFGTPRVKIPVSAL